MDLRLASEDCAAGAVVVFVSHKPLRVVRDVTCGRVAECALLDRANVLPVFAAL